MVVKSNILRFDILKKRREIKRRVMLYYICCHNVLSGSSLSGTIAVQTTKLVIVVQYQIKCQSFLSKREENVICHRHHRNNRRP